MAQAISPISTKLCPLKGFNKRLKKPNRLFTMCIYLPIQKRINERTNWFRSILSVYTISIHHTVALIYSEQLQYSFILICNCGSHELLEMILVSTRNRLRNNSCMLSTINANINFKTHSCVVLSTSIFTTLRKMPCSVACQNNLSLSKLGLPRR